jgi:hypothetical protein
MVSVFLQSLLAATEMTNSDGKANKLGSLWGVESFLWLWGERGEPEPASPPGMQPTQAPSSIPACEQQAASRIPDPLTFCKASFSFFFFASCCLPVVP